VISVLHSFFDWANAEDLIEVDPSAKIRRPKKRRPDVYRPNLEELRRIREVALPHERPALVLMEGAGLRRSEVLALPKSCAKAYASSSPSSMTTSLRLRLSSGSRNMSVSVGERIRNSRQAGKRLGEWFAGLADEPGCVI
jgi:site-specific recombinase XerD